MSSGAQRFQWKRKGEEIVRKHPLNYNNLLSRGALKLQLSADPLAITRDTKRNSRENMHCMLLPLSSLPGHNIATINIRVEIARSTIKQCISIPLLAVQQMSQWTIWRTLTIVPFSIKRQWYGEPANLTPNCASCFASWPQMWLHRWACPVHQFPCQALIEQELEGRKL